MKSKRMTLKRVCAVFMAVVILGTAVNLPWDTKAERMELPTVHHSPKENGMKAITGVTLDGDTLKLQTKTASGQDMTLLLSFLKDGGIRLCAEDSIREIKNQIFEPVVTSVTITSHEGKVLKAEGKESGTKIVLDYRAGNWTLSVCKQGTDEIVYTLWADQLATKYDGDKRTDVSFWGDIAENEKFIGLGEQYGEAGNSESGFILNGRRVELWNNDSFCQDSYANVPLLHSSRGYSVFFNSYYAGIADIGKEVSNSFYMDFAGPDLDLYVWTETPLENVKSYTKLTGTSATIPRWAIGYWTGGAEWNYWQQNGTLTSSEEQMETLQKMFKGYEALGTLPSVVYIEGQLSRCEEAYQLCAEKGAKLMGWWGPFHPWAYSGPQKYDEEYTAALLPDLDRASWPMIRTENGDFYWEYGNGTDSPRTLRVDYTAPTAYRLIASNLGKFWEYGLSGLLVDYGDIIPVNTWFANGLTGDEMHQLQPYFYYKRHREVWEAHLEEGVVKDDFMLFGRSGCAGSQKYAGMAGGDQRSAWNWDYENGKLVGGGLKQAINGALSAGTAGFSVWGTDIGGYSPCTDKELYQRWLAFSTFSPLMRTHGAGGVDPWDYEDDSVKTTFQKYYWLRENMEDAIYSAVLRSHADGTPIMQSMALAYPDTLFSVEDQYMFCDDIMVCPVYEQGQTSRTVILPKGTWYDMLTGKAVSGNGQAQSVSAAVDQIPAYIKSGSIVPMDVSSKTWNLTDAMNDGSSTQTLLVTPGANGQKRSFEWNVSEEEKKTYASATQDGVYTITAGQGANPKVIMAYDMNAEQVTVDGMRLNQLFSQPDGTQAGFYTDEAGKMILVLPSADWKEIQVVSPKTWDYGFNLTYQYQPIGFLDHAFETYMYGDPATSVEAVGGAHKPSDIDSENAEGSYSYYTTAWFGSHSQGYLKPTRILDGGYTTLTYKNSSYKDFEAEYEMLTAWGVFGLSFGGGKERFPVSLDGNVSNDTGVMLFMENDGCLSIGGAINAGTAVCSDAAVTVAQGGQSLLYNTNNIRTSPLAKEIEPVSDPGNNPETYTICVKVKNGTLTVWEKTSPEKKISVQLMDQYQGGYVSMIANRAQHGAFKAFHVRSLEQEMYYPVNFENLSNLTELDDAFTAYHMGNAYGTDKVEIDYALQGAEQVDLNNAFNSYYFENDTAAAKKGNPTDQWTNSNTVPFEGYWQNKGLKPVHVSNGEAQTLLTIKERLGSDFTATVQYNTTFVGYGIMMAPEGELANGENGFMVCVNSDGSIHVKGAIDASTAKWSGTGAVTQHHAGSVTGPAQSGYIRPVGDWNDANNAYYDLTVSIRDGKLTANVTGHQGENFTGTLTVDLTKDYAGGSLSLWSTGCNQGCFRQLIVNGDKVSEAGRPSEYWTRKLHPNLDQIGTNVPYLKPNHGKDGSMTLLTYNKAMTRDFRARVEIANNWVGYGLLLAPAGQMLTASNGIGVYVESDGSIHVMGAVDCNTAKGFGAAPSIELVSTNEIFGLTNGIRTNTQKIEEPSGSNTKDTVYTLCVSHVNGLLSIYLEQYPDNVVTVETMEDYRGGSLSLFSLGWNQGGFKSLEFDTFTEDTATWEKGRQGDYVTFTLRTDIAYGSLSARAQYATENLEYVEAVTPDGVTADVWDTNGSLQLYLKSDGAHYGEWITLVFKPKTDEGKAGSLSDLTMRVADTQSAARTARIQQIFPGDINNDCDVNVKDLVRLKKYAEDKTIEIHKANSRLNINTKIEEAYNQKLMRKKLVK